MEDTVIYKLMTDDHIVAKILMFSILEFKSQSRKRGTRWMMSNRSSFCCSSGSSKLSGTRTEQVTRTEVLILDMWIPHKDICIVKETQSVQLPVNSSVAESFLLHNQMPTADFSYEILNGNKYFSQPLCKYA